MAAESDDERLSIRLPPDLGEWLDERASEHGTDREQLLQRLLEVSRLVLTDGDTDVSGLAARIDGLEDDLDEKITDVRSRVLQVKREADTKAPADHSHPELERIDDFAAEISTLQADLADARAALDDETSSLATDLADLRADIDALKEAVGDHDEQFATVQDRLRRVAGIVVQLKRAVEDTDDEQQLAELKRIAAQRGFQSATCGDCGRSVNLGLLTVPSCPHCEMRLHDVTGTAGFLSTPTLVGEDEQ